jgi:phospholipid/cholesterol/gamma-HCH transport system substrate-binding protein
VKIKFNQYERVAGIFVLSAMVGAVALSFAVALKRGWFESKISFETDFTSAEGIHAGTSVQMSGLKAGSVTEVDLQANNQVHVHFEVSSRFAALLRADSRVHLMRPFIIGDKILDVTVGAEKGEPLKEGTLLASEDSMDLMDLLSGRKLGPYLSTLDKMTENLKFVAEAFLDPARSHALIQIFDEMSPLLKNVNSMSREVGTLLHDVNHKQGLAITIQNLAAITGELNQALPAIREQAPGTAKDVVQLAHNLAVLTEEMQKVLPVVSEMAPEFPRASRRALEALDETVVTLKALQKSFLLRGSVHDVREEEAAAQTRKPAAAANPAVQTVPAPAK